MQKNKIYNQDIIDVLKAEINKFREENKNELTPDKVLVLAKKDIAELIELNCTAKELAAIFNKAGIKVSANKIKQLYFTPIPRNKSQLTTKTNQLVKE